MVLLRLICYELHRVADTYQEYNYTLARIFGVVYTRTHKCNEAYEILEFSYNKANNII